MQKNWLNKFNIHSIKKMFVL